MDETSVDPRRARTPVLVGSLSTWFNEGKYVTFVCLSVCPSVWSSVCLYVCLSVRVVGEGVGGGRRG